MIKFIAPILGMVIMVTFFTLSASKADSKYSFEQHEDEILISSLYDHDDDWGDEDEDEFTADAKKDKTDKKSGKKKKKKDKK